MRRGTPMPFSPEERKKKGLTVPGPAKTVKTGAKASKPGYAGPKSTATRKPAKRTK